MNSMESMTVYYDYTKLDAIAAVIFRTNKVEEDLLYESEKIIIEFATMTATIIAEMKYPSVFCSYIGFSVDRLNHFQIIFLMYKHFPHGYGFCTGFTYEIYLLIHKPHTIKTYTHFSSLSERTGNPDCFS